MRLIDGDALIEKFNEKVDMAECLIDARTAERFSTFCALADAVEEMPTVDAVEVVRCRQCKHCEPENHHCDHYMGTVAPLRREPDDFCSYGERKEGADNGKVSNL